MPNLIYSLRFKILFTVAFVLFVGGLGFAYRDYLEFQNRVKDKREQTFETFQKVFENELEMSEKNLSMAMEILLKNENIVRAFAEKDRETLKTLTLDFYNKRLKPIYKIDQFQFHLPSGQSFLRVHRPEKHGDNVSTYRKTVVNANAQETPSIGIEVGRSGAGLRIVYPVKYGGEHIGSVEFGGDLESVLYNAQKTSKANYALGIYSKVFKRAKRFENLDSDIKKDNTVFYAFSSLEAIKVLNKIDLENDDIMFSYDGKHFIKDCFPIKDYSKNNIGTLFVFKDVTEKYNSEIKRIFTNLGYLFLSVLFVTAMIYFMLYRLIITPVREAVSATKDLSEGNLSVDLDVNRQDEMGQMLREISQMAHRMQDMIRAMSSVVRDVNISATELADTVSNQASTVVEQSASISQITTTMEELSASSTQIYENSHSVVEIAQKTLDDSKKGESDVMTITRNMTEISKDNDSNLAEILGLGKKSRDITKIMELINNIADQTKLIAFNASLEASSAGEAGKRFGVVAIEIRRLADSVMESTNEIEEKISEIQDSINRLVLTSEKGTQVIHDGQELSVITNKKLSNIVGGANSTSESAKEILLSTQQQQSAIEQVVLALKEIEEGARQSSKEVNQTSLISKNLAVLSNTLKESIGKFKIAKSD